MFICALLLIGLAALDRIVIGALQSAERVHRYLATPRIDRSHFTNASTLSSFAVESKVHTGIQAGLRSGIAGVPLVLGISLVSHDNSFAATAGGRVLGVIELERLHKIRYFALHNERFSSGLGGTLEEAMARYVVPALRRLCEVVVAQLDLLQSAKPCDIEYDIAVYAHADYGIASLKHIVKAVHWHRVDHHHAHAALGWLDSPFYHGLHTQMEGVVSLVISYDGIGNDGTLRMFTAQARNATLSPFGASMVGRSFGFSYRLAAIVVRDLAWGSPYGAHPPCGQQGNYMVSGLKLPGTFMAYAAIGVVREDWRMGAELFLSRGVWQHSLWPSPRGGVCELIKAPLWDDSHCPYFSCSGADENASRQFDRDFAATVEDVFEKVVVDFVEEKMTHVVGPPATSLVITGGCALNVKTNSALARKFGLPIHVPSAPGDHGLALGAAWLVAPPPPAKDMLGIQYSGLPLSLGSEWLDSSRLQVLAARWGATKLPSIEWLAKSLIGGSIFGIAHGRAEFGPRALGHRSLLSGANRADQKDRLNRLKRRQWYRPCAPMVAAEDLDKVFEPGPDLVLGSPYMSFAPTLQTWVRTELPAIAHIDNTSRPQSVRPDDDSWLHSLLVAVRSASTELKTHSGDHKHPAVGVLINTSLNNQGRPIANDVLDILLLFCAPHGNELDFVLLEKEWVFERNEVVSRSLCG